MPRSRISRPNPDEPALESAADPSSSTDRESGSIKAPASEATEGVNEPSAPEDPTDQESLEDLSFLQARTALELTLMQLQAADLDVEQMIGLYRRGERYADRCEAVLQQVEQEVMLWNSEDAGGEPTPYKP